MSFLNFSISGHGQSISRACASAQALTSPSLTIRSSLRAKGWFFCGTSLPMRRATVRCPQPSGLNIPGASVTTGSELYFWEQILILFTASATTINHLGLARLMGTGKASCSSTPRAIQTTDSRPVGLPAVQRGDHREHPNLSELTMPPGPLATTWRVVPAATTTSTASVTSSSFSMGHARILPRMLRDPVSTSRVSK